MTEVTVDQEQLDALAHTVRSISPSQLPQDERAQLMAVLAVAKHALATETGSSIQSLVGSDQRIRVQVDDDPPPPYTVQALNDAAERVVGLENKIGKPVR